MKKLFLFVLAFTFFFIACDNTPASNDEKQHNEDSTQTDEKNASDENEEEKQQANPEIKAIAKEDVPFEYIFTPVGKGLIDAFEVKDANGKCYLLRGKNFLEGNNQLVVTYLEPAADKPKILTSYVEDLMNCQFDLVEEHIKEVKITDLDADGTAELMMMFKLDCTSDVSPNKLYLALFEGEDRYIMKGVTEVDGMGGEFEADEAFKANETFLKAATDFWNQHKTESYN
jgi:hypothetical protein